MEDEDKEMRDVFIYSVVFKKRQWVQKSPKSKDFSERKYMYAPYTFLTLLLFD